VNGDPPIFTNPPLQEYAMSALSTLGFIHTAISLAAVGAGALALFRDGRIDPGTRPGFVYLVTTVLTCLSGLFIFAHGGFGKPHLLSIITLATLALAVVARWSRLFGRAAAAVEMVLYSLTFFFHMVPGVTETLTRLPAGAPVFDNPEAAGLAMIHGAMFCVFVAGSVWQVRMRKNPVQPGRFGSA
jgi:uncharacterized membrane protein